MNSHKTFLISGSYPVVEFQWYSFWGKKKKKNKLKLGLKDLTPISAIGCAVGEYHFSCSTMSFGDEALLSMEVDLSQSMNSSGMFITRIYLILANPLLICTYSAHT